jgi:hypothetical protein
LIFVCHYENIENIFHHFYGDNVDFYGYISKFSSTKPFVFSLKEQLPLYIESILPDKIQKSQKISKILATHILERYNQTNIKESLRTLREKLVDYQPHIRNERILVDSHENAYISSINNLSILLDLINRFSINVENFIRDIYRSKSYEFINFVDVCWTLNEFNNNKGGVSTNKNQYILYLTQNYDSIAVSMSIKWQSLENGYEIVSVNPPSLREDNVQRLFKILAQIAKKVMNEYIINVK